jgi:hypothetical protein
MKKIKLLPTEYIAFLQIAKFSYVTLGIMKGLYIVEANKELLKQIGY